MNPQLKLPVIFKLFLLDTFNCSRLSFTEWQSRWSSEWMDEWINEWTTKGVGYFGEWCGVGVLLPGRSEDSHELKMRFLSSSDGFTSTALSHDNLKIRLKSQEAAQLWLKRWADCCDWSSFDRLIDWRTCHCCVSDSKKGFSDVTMKDSVADHNSCYEAFTSLHASTENPDVTLF